MAHIRRLRPSDDPQRTVMARQPVSKVPHLPGIEKGPASSSATQSFLTVQPHAPEPVGPDELLIVPQIPTQQRSRSDHQLDCERPS